jgi:GAF domain-containing protein
MRKELLDVVARAVLGASGARAASIAVLDEHTDELVFAAACGEGADHLRGARFPAHQGIAGAVLSSGAPVVIDDVDRDPRFARDVATETGYVPDALVVLPIVRDGRPCGVLEVLDRDAAFPLPDEMAVLRALADQAALAL